MKILEKIKRPLKRLALLVAIRYLTLVLPNYQSYLIMNEQPLDSDFSTAEELSITPKLRAHFSEIARWARFLAIVGFVSIGLMVIAAFAIGFLMNDLANQFGGSGTMPSSALTVMYLLIAALYFLPVLYLFRFAGRMQLALKTDSNDELMDAFANLKAMFKFIGILTIVMLGLYALAIIFSVVVGAFATL